MPLLDDPCQCFVNNLARTPKEAYSMSEPWWRVNVWSEMSERIANLQFFYKRAGRSFFDEPSLATDLPCYTDRQGLTHLPSVASEAPNYPPRVDSRATERGNSSDVLSHRSDSTGIPRGSVKNYAYQPMNVAEEETHH